MRTIILSVLILGTIPGFAKGPNNPEIEFQNTVLARVRGKNISLVDVIKYMDLYIYEAGRDPKEVPVDEKFQFYTTNWKTCLDKIIDSELMLLDAEEKKVQTSDGDVRAELHARFGPNVMATLDHLGLSLEEGKNYVRNDLTVQKMQWHFVNSRARQLVTPQTVREAFTNYLEKNPAKDAFQYQFLTVRSSDTELAEHIAEQAYAHIHEKGESLEATAQTLSKAYENAKITLSREVKADDTEIAREHKNILQTLKLEEISKPLKQVSKNASKPVFRIFALKNREHKAAATFEEIHDKLQNVLVQQIVVTEKQKYIRKLREKYDVTQEKNALFIPEDYSPFYIK